jgi:hypothetical protein
MQRGLLALGLLLAVGGATTLVVRGSSCTRHELSATWNRVRGDPYPLDEIDRNVAADGSVDCPEIELVEYDGTTLTWKPRLKVARPFVARLQELERIANELAIDVYGRPPKAIRHAGAYACRRIQHRRERLSEHALGNAVDFVGFDFGPAAADGDLPAQLPSALERGFFVRVKRDWQADAGGSAVHARFLERLVARLREEKTFRAMLGPAHEFHSEGDHWHFDYGPWSLVRL